MSSTHVDPSKALIRAELSSKVREALEGKDWAMLEHWAKQWIQLDPGNVAGFKWLARSTLAQTKLAKAAYSFGRILDFEPGNVEARKFFSQNPSLLSELPASVIQILKQNIQPNGQREELAHDPMNSKILSDDKSRKLAAAEADLARKYEQEDLFQDAAERYAKSHSWYPSQAAALGAARCLHKIHRSLEAVRFLRAQLFDYPEWTQGRILLGKVLMDLGHRTDAQREWQTVLQQDPKNQSALECIMSIMRSAQT